MANNEKDYALAIQVANEAIKGIDVKGKAYAEVNQRVKAFRAVFPTGSIETEILHLEGEEGRRRILVRASVFDENERFLADGLAEEKEASSYINKTSFIENAQTSAVGRALGFLGFGIDTSIASKEEVETAINNQNADVPQTAEELHRRNEEARKKYTATGNQVSDIRKYYTGKNLEKMLAFYGVKEPRDLLESQAEEAINRAKEALKKRAESK